MGRVYASNDKKLFKEGLLGPGKINAKTSAGIIPPFRPHYILLMAKKCIICDEAEARYCIKGTSDFYCEQCAIDSFGDIAMLVKVEDEAQRLKGVIEDRMAENKKED